MPRLIWVFAGRTTILLFCRVGAHLIFHCDKIPFQIVIYKQNLNFCHFMWNLWNSPTVRFINFKQNNQLWKKPTRANRWISGQRFVRLASSNCIFTFYHHVSVIANIYNIRIVVDVILAVWKHCCVVDSLYRANNNWNNNNNDQSGEVETNIAHIHMLLHTSNLGVTTFSCCSKQW